MQKQCNTMCTLIDLPFDIWREMTAWMDLEMFGRMHIARMPGTLFKDHKYLTSTVVVRRCHNFLKFCRKRVHTDSVSTLFISTDDDHLFNLFIKTFKHIKKIISDGRIFVCEGLSFPNIEEIHIIGSFTRGVGFSVENFPGLKRYRIENHLPFMMETYLMLLFCIFIESVNEQEKRDIKLEIYTNSCTIESIKRILKDNNTKHLTCVCNENKL